jgi:hypothetical protein
MKLPEHVYQTLVAVCNGYPWPTVQKDEHLGEILNAVAWVHRDEGWGLSRKTGGRHVDSPVGPIAEDILQLPDGNHFDVLGGAAVGNPLRPNQGESIGIINLRDRPWVAPVAHTVSWRQLDEPDDPPPPPDPPPTNGGNPVPPPTVDNGPVLAAIEALSVEVRALTSEMATIKNGLFKEGPPEAPSVLQHIDDAKQRIDKVLTAVNSKSGGGRPSWPFGSEE